MSDSDETVCNESGEENENNQNSPSILSNWRQDEAVFSTQTEEKSPEKNLGTEREENRDIVNGDGTITSSEPEISPEFPLITRGLKRKESCDGIDDANSDAKEVYCSETNATSTDSELNVSNANVVDSETTTDEDKRLETLLKTVEQLVRDMEITFKRDSGNICSLRSLQDAKSQLADIQKILVESNRENQAKRKTVLSDSENTQQLNDENKLVIFSLAKKQRKLLEGFQRYKNLVKKLKAIKDLKDTSQSQRSEPLFSNHHSGTGYESGSEQLSECSIQKSSQNSQNPLSANMSKRTLPSIPSFERPPDYSVNQAPSQNLTKTAQRLVITNTTNTGLAKAIKQGSVQFMLLKNQTSNLTASLSKSSGVPVPLKSITASTMVSRKSITPPSNNPSWMSQNNPQSSIPLCPTTKNQSLALTNRPSTTNQATVLTSSRNTPSIAKSSCNTLSNPQISTLRPDGDRSGMTQNSSPTTNIRPSTPKQTDSNKRPINQVTKVTTQFQTIPSLTNRSGMNQATNLGPSTPRQTQPLANKLPTSQVTTLTTQFQNTPGSTLCNRSGTNQTTSQFSKTIPRFASQRQNFLPRCGPSSTDLGASSYTESESLSQSNTRGPEQAISMVKQASGLSLSLDTLVKKGVLAPGQNVLTATSEGKLYSASLSDKGTIISAGGEGFTSPRSWMKAILGSKRKVRNELAWKMVSYKNKPLLDHASTVTPSEQTQTSVNLNPESINQCPIQTKIVRNNPRELINSAVALKALLSNCRVLGISKEEVLPSDALPKDLWDNADAEWLNDDILKALDF